MLRGVLSGAVPLRYHGEIIVISLGIDRTGDHTSVAVPADHNLVEFFLQEDCTKYSPINGLSQNGYGPSPISRPDHV